MARSCPGRAGIRLHDEIDVMLTEVWQLVECVSHPMCEDRQERLEGVYWEDLRLVEGVL